MSLWDDIRPFLLGIQHGAERAGLGPLIRGGPYPSSVNAARIATGRPSIYAGAPSSSRTRQSGMTKTGFRTLRKPQRAMEEKQQGPNPLDDILSMMQEMLLGGGGGQVDLGNLRSQIEAQINPVFDARRRAIENLMARAQTRTAANRADVTGAYNALGKNYEETAVQQQAAGAQAAAEAAALQGKLKSNIHGNYSRVQDEQAELFKELGIEAAAPAILPDQAADQAFLLGNVEQTGAANQQFLKNQGTIDQQYYQQGAPLARLQGQNISSDLMLMLEDYLSRQGDVISELEAARQGEITGSFNQLAAGAQEQGQKGQQQLWERLMDLYGIQNERMNAKQTQTGNLPIDIASSLGLPPQMGMQVQDAWADILSTPAALYGRVEDPRTGEQVKTTPARLEQEVRKYARENNLPPQVVNALLVAVSQYMGRR